MKKFLLLMLVLGLATSAQAGLIFTINGDETQPDEVWLVPSQILELDLELDAIQTISGITLDYVLSNAQAEFITDGASRPEYPGLTDIEFPSDPLFDLDGTTPIVRPQLVQITTGQLFNPALQGPLVLMTELYVHCLDASDVILQIISQGSTINGEFIAPGTIMHTLTIHQIPEPMTIALLGLGGLFALRRKKR